MFSSSYASSEIKLEKSDFVASAQLAGQHNRKSGWMIKQGQKNKSDFKKRYFILDRNCLFYYVSEDVKSVIGMIWVEDCKVETLNIEGGVFPFRLLTVGGREFFLKCLGEEDRISWMEHLRESQFSQVKSTLDLHAGETTELATARDAARLEVEALRQKAEEQAQMRHQAQREVEGLKERLKEQADASNDQLEALRREKEAKERSTAQSIEQLEQEKEVLVHSLNSKESEFNSSAKEMSSLRREKETQEKLSLLELTRLEQEKAAMEESLISAKFECDILRRSKGIRVRAAGADDDFAADGERSLRLWVGSWNLGASEPFDSKDGTATRLLRDNFIVGDPCDLYFLGLQEGVTESVFNTTESLAGILAKCERIPLSDQSSNNNSGASAAGSAGTDDKGVSRDKIHGRGDGSLMGTKFTGLALYVNKERCHDVRVIGCVAHPLEKLGSKGGVAVALNISGSTIVFVTCHLEAMKRDVRRLQYRELMTQLGEKLGEKDFDLTVQFHHVIWTGDLNYRCVETNGDPMSSDRVGTMLRAGLNGQLFEEHDQLNQERRTHEVFSNFREPLPHPEFYPTYKKYEGRELTNYDGDWVSQVYRMRYKEPIYKGGNVKERTPGFCDRVLFHSQGDAWRRLAPEKKSLVTEVIDGGDGAQLSVDCDNYWSVNDGPGMSVSDHSPVSAVFHLRTVQSPPAVVRAHGRSRNKTVTTNDASPHVHQSLFECPVVTIEIMQFMLRGGKVTPEATRLDVMFPAPGEVAEGAQCMHETKGDQANGWIEEATRLKGDCRRLSLCDHLFGATNPMPIVRMNWNSSSVYPSPGVGSLHLLLCVRGGTFVTVGHHKSASDNMKDIVSAHCAIGLADAAAMGDDVSFVKNDEGVETEVFMSLKGLSLTAEGRPAFYPPGSTDQLTADVQIRIYRR